MLINSLLPLLARYSLGFDLVAGAGDVVTLTIIPRKAEGAKATVEPAEVRPIAITATAAEIDAELARGTEGALGRLFQARKELGDQLAEQRAAADHAKGAAASKAKPAPAAAAKPEKLAPPPAAAAAQPNEPVSLW